MKIKIAEREEIQNVGDALDRLAEWVAGYASTVGRPNEVYVVRDADVVKEADGWYAYMQSAPRLKE